MTLLLLQLPAIPIFNEQVVTTSFGRVTVIFIAYALTLLLSGRVVRFFVLSPESNTKWPPSKETPPAGGWPRFDPSTIIGKCENIITVTLVLTGNISGLAVIFAAKSLVRSDVIKKNPGFYLGGTMVNLVWGLMIAFAARLLLGG